MLRFEIISIFPRIFDSYFNTSIIGRALKRKLIKIKIHDLRKWTKDRHRTVDDRPYGGGPGMVMKADVLYQAIKSVRGRILGKSKKKVILLTPAGKQFDQRMAEKYGRLDRIIFVCGRYEGFDARVEKLVDEKISTGPYVLTGGELPAMAVIDAVTRLLPGAIRKESLEEESFSKSIGEAEYPQYTRPEILVIKDENSKIRKLKVPSVLLSGDQKRVKEWKLRHSG